MKEITMFKKRNFLLAGMIYVFLFILMFQIPGMAVSKNPDTKQDSDIVRGEVGKRLDAYFTRIVPFGFSGALLAAKDGEIVLNKGYGMAVRSEGITNTSETVFSTGSITKQFTAAGIMKLEMQEKLSTDDPITKFFEDVPDDKKGITIHHLLTHSAGVVNFTGMDYEKAGRDETVRKILDAPLLFPPGERFQYSNAGYSMLAAVIEKVSGRSYEEFQNENLFKPAGMEWTGYRIPEWGRKVVAHWYVGEKDNGTPLEKPYPYWNLLGNGGIISTTRDMYRWHVALLGDRVLSDEARKKIFTPYINDYGYGWDVLKSGHGTLIQHDGGSMLGNSAEVRRYIDAGVVTILFCNQSYGEKAMFDVLRDKIEALVFGGDVAVPPSVKAMDKESLRKYEGTYRLPGGGRLAVKAEGSKLLISAEEQDAVNALFSSGKASADSYKDLNKLSASVFTSVLKGDFGPFEDLLLNREERAEPVREFIEMSLKRGRERTGEIKEAVALGTLPSVLRGEEAALTYVELRGERGSLYFGLYWNGGLNAGIRPVMFRPDFSIPFLSVSENFFAGYSIEMAQNFRVSFSTGDKGFINGLTIHTQAGDVRADKIVKIR